MEVFLMLGNIMDTWLMLKSNESFLIKKSIEQLLNLIVSLNLGNFYKVQVMPEIIVEIHEKYD